MDWQTLKQKPEKWKLFRQRAEIISNIRRFFQDQGFFEVQTPLLAPNLIPESYLEVFETQLKDKTGKTKRAFLTTSPEMWHKKLLAAGSGNIFEITKSFRNTDIGSHYHNPEFTILEWYRTGVDYKATMEDCERLIRFLNHGNTINYQKKSYDIAQPFLRLSVAEAFRQYAGIDAETFFEPQNLIEQARKKGYQIRPDDDWETIFNLVYMREVEPHLGEKQPTIIYDFPAQFAPLAKTSKKDPRLKERFELYIGGIELADAYNELTDPDEQEQQFRREIRLRKKLGKLDYPADNDFLTALKSGIPDCSGVALGIDRLVMLLTDKTDIGEVMLFSGEDIFPSL